MTYLHHHGLTCWFRFSFHKNLMKAELQIELITSMLSFFHPRENTCDNSTSTLLHTGHEKPLSSDFMCFVFSLSSRPLPKTLLFAPITIAIPLAQPSHSFFWVTFCETSLFCNVPSVDWMRNVSFELLSS